MEYIAIMKQNVNTRISIGPVCAEYPESSVA